FVRSQELSAKGGNSGVHRFLILRLFLFLFLFFFFRVSGLFIGGLFIGGLFALGAIAILRVRIVLHRVFGFLVFGGLRIVFLVHQGIHQRVNLFHRRGIHRENELMSGCLVKL